MIDPTTLLGELTDMSMSVPGPLPTDAASVDVAGSGGNVSPDLIKQIAGVLAGLFRPCNKSPWDEASYFNPPLGGVAMSAAAGTIAVVPADPFRAVLVLSTDTVAGIIVTPTSPGTASGGQIFIVPGAGPLKLTWKDDGPLCTAAWSFVATAAGQSLHWQGVSLNRWEY